MREAIIALFENKQYDKGDFDPFIELRIKDVNIMRMMGRYFVFPINSGAGDGYTTVTEAVEAFLKKLEE